MAQLGPHLSLLRANQGCVRAASFLKALGENLLSSTCRVPSPCWLSAGGQSLFLEAAPNLFHASYVASLQQWQVMSSQSSNLFSFPICSMGQVDSSAFLDCLCDYFAQTLRAQGNFSILGQ